ncbi:hypothetical protein SAMN04487950_1852 [Halogranum rubrum]|uniref:Uncharacterized protein n=2 Tax=Halogranum rubrum TaxID=553466 RepID=A0A1I4E418_9EURY|nr:MULTISPECIES: hypothetical protein [Halogranum]EJN60798.1 hypothetical protein HSB1_14010 [Halogranum salarium B-1]SFL00003.1 hypothetical protein SAMN04487950_1852 [Halogranum rubrum]
MRRRSDRAQLSLSAIEASVGVVLVLAVAAGFGLGLPQPETQAAQLDAYATDATTVLSREAPRHGGATRLSEVTRSETSFTRERDALERRVDRILPANLMFRLQTPHGSVGYRRPTGVPVGQSTVTTLHGDVTIWVWYT